MGVCLGSWRWGWRGRSGVANVGVGKRVAVRKNGGEGCLEGGSSTACRLD